MSCSNTCLCTRENPQILRQLSTLDIGAIRELQREVNETLPDGFLRFKEEHELTRYLEGGTGAAFGIFDNDELLAMALVRIPDAENPYHLEAMPRVPKHDWPMYAAMLENAMVTPKARGRGYQRALLDARAAYAKATGMRWICGGARLSNIYSWRNLLASGMIIVGLRVNGGQTLIGLLQPIEDNSALQSSVTNRRLVLVDDADAHLRALEAGYVGTQLTASGFVVYQLWIP
jgi:GNAT superfamily N-acetyltransferase